MSILSYESDISLDVRTRKFPKFYELCVVNEISVL